MQNWKSLLTTLGGIAITLAVLGLVLGLILTNFLVDFWWFSSLDYGSYFWLRVLYRYIFSGGVTLFFFLIFFLNLWAASRYLGVDEEALSAMGPESGKRYRRLLRLFQSGTLQVFIPFAVVLAIVVAIPFYTEWESALLFFFGPNSDQIDPIFNVDVSYFMFRMPMAELVQQELLIAIVLLTLSIAVLYWWEHKLVPDKAREWPTGAKLHLSLLVAISALVTIWGFFLDKHGMLYVNAHEPVFYGPGFVEMNYVVPLIWLSILLVAASAISGIYYGFTGKGFKTCASLIVLFLIAWGMRYSGALPRALDRFLVKPNPVKFEKPYMAANIEATLRAYDLKDVSAVDVTAATRTDVLEPRMREHLHNIPIWDPEFLDDVYQQLQGIRPYYNFTDVDAARYTINGKLEQVNLAAREINISKLPPEAQNWENRHLRYTHGYGAVVTPAAQDGEVPMKWFLRDLNLQSDVGFKIERPDIYFGTENLEYALVPNRLRVPGISTFDDMESSQSYSGKDGIRISTWFRRLLLSMYFRDEKMFFSINIDSNSRALFRRNILERVQTLAPFLNLDHDPYIVVSPQRIYWILDAYTTSDRYPVSKDLNFAFAGPKGDEEPKNFNYIRNSVKVVIDAFDGTVDFYITNTKDPVIMGYQKAYPSLFKNISTMPPLLREQVRYPRDYLQMQMGIFSKYHQTDPAMFYQQGETWDFSMVGGKAVRPYYLTTRLDGAEEIQPFVLLNPMTPVGRNNLSALAVAGGLQNDAAGLPFFKEIVMFKFSRDVQVNGPSQVNALIDQDPEVAQMFTLWDQRGSQVKRGRIIVLPIGKSILYVQPVYIVSRGETKIPELVRVILSMGNVVVMEASLERAWDKLDARLKTGVKGTTSLLPFLNQMQQAPAPATPPQPVTQ